MNPKLNKSIFLEGARIFIKNLEIASPLEFDIKHNFPFIKLHFVLEGKCHYEPNCEKGVPITIGNNQYNFFYLPEVQGKFSLNSKSIYTVDIEFEEVFLKKLFKHQFFKISGEFGKAIKDKTPFKMWSKSQEISPFLNTELNKIIEESESKEINLKNIENQLTIILSHLFIQISTVQPSFKITTLTITEEEEVNRAEKILRAHIKKGITVEELSAAIGTNRHKLNRNFKHIYNEPVFTYLTHLRMDKAKAMLQQNKMNVSEVAYTVGYKNPQHFTVAFKKYYGCLPSMVN